jgi:hypothetical protein
VFLSASVIRCLDWTLTPFSTEPLPRHLVPLGLISQVIKDLPVAADARVLSAVADLATLAEALKACPISMVVIGPGWPAQDLAAAREMILDHAAACVEATDLAPAALQSAMSVALEERDRRVASGFFTQYDATAACPGFLQGPLWPVPAGKPSGYRIDGRNLGFTAR